MNIGTALSAAVKIGHATINYFKDPKKSYVKGILKCLNKATLEQLEYLKTKVSNHMELPDSQLIYWEEKKLEVFFHNKIIKDNGFVFYSCNTGKLAEEISTYFVLSGHQLQNCEKESIVEIIIKIAQKIYRAEQTNDPKVMNFNHMQEGVTLGRIVEFVSDIPKLLKKFEQWETKYGGVQDEEKDFLSLYNKCVEFYKRKQYLQCLYEIDKVLEIKEITPEQKISLLILQVAIHYEQYNYDSAYQTLLTIEELMPKDNNELAIKLYEIKGGLLSEKGDRDNDKRLMYIAIGYFEKQLELIDLCDTSNLANVYYNLGTTYLNLSDYEPNNQQHLQKAIEYFKLSIEMNNTRAQAFKNLGSAYRLVHKHDEEIDCYYRALQLEPNLFQALCAMGLVKLKYFNDPYEALKYYKKAAKQNNEVVRFPSLFYWMAEAYIQVGELQEALHIIEKGLWYSPTSDHMIHQKADILRGLMLDNPQKNYSSYVDYILKNFSELDEFIVGEIIDAYVNAKQYDQLKLFLNTVSEELKVNYSMYSFYFKWAYNLLDEERYSDIEEVLSFIDVDKLDNNKDRTHFYYLKGILSYEKDEWKEALSHNLLLLEYNTLLEEYDILSQIGAIYLGMKDYNQARIYFRKAQKSSPYKTFEIEYGLCRAYIGLKRITPAREALRDMAKLDSLSIVRNIVIQSKGEGKEDVVNNQAEYIVKCIGMITVLYIKEKLDKGEILIPKNEEESKLLQKEYMDYAFKLVEESLGDISQTAKNFSHIMTSMIEEKIERAKQEI